MELIKLTDKTYYIKNRTNIGIYLVDDKNVYLIDSGNDKDAGKKILKIIDEQNWNVLGIINTHSHADHCGGNEVIEKRTNCKIYSEGIEKDIINHPLLEASLLYGASPLKELRNKFLMAKPSNCQDLQLPNGLEKIDLKGHCFDMIGIKTDDDIYFIGDALADIDTIYKYHMFYIYDVQEYLNTLDFLATLKGKLFIPSHGEATSDISEKIAINRSKINEISNLICEYCIEPKTLEEIIKYLFDHYESVMNLNQYYLIGDTIKAFLSYLNANGEIGYIFKDNKMLWAKL